MVFAHGTKRTVCRTISLGTMVVMTAVVSGNAGEPASAAGDDGGLFSPMGDYFQNWFDRVSATQAEQPHWATPVATVTPRLEEELRYDQFRESLPGGHRLDNFDGGKGLELIPAERVELIIGIPAYETENTSPRKDGWTDEALLVKYRLLAANEENGNYILTAFMGLSVPSGSDDFSSHHFGFTPTLAAGKGWGRFDLQTTLGVSIADNGATREGAGTPILSNTALQYHVDKYFWPEVEANYTYWPNGEHEYKNQLFITPGLVLGRFPIWKRVGITVGVGYQVAVTDEPLIRNNFILSARIPF